MTAPTAPQGDDWIDALFNKPSAPGTPYNAWIRTAKNVIRSRISEAEAAIRRSQTDHLFSVIRHCGYKIDQRAVEKLSKQWNDAAAKHAAEVQARQADKPTLADIASPNPSEAAQAAVQRAVDASIKRQADTSGRE